MVRFIVENIIAFIIGMCTWVGATMGLGAVGLDVPFAPILAVLPAILSYVGIISLANQA